MPRKWLYIAVPLTVWLGIIFATSSTWIDRDRFVAAIVPLLPGGWLKNAFVQFWYHAGGLAAVKGYHVAEFALLYVLCNKGLTALTRLPATRAALCSGAFCLLYAASDEWHQTFVPGRGGTLMDVAIDGFGIGVALLPTIRRTRRGRTGNFVSAGSVSDPAKVIL
jgi:hypothetical protein